jgi:sulfonate transport system substrate-binding protein
VHFNGTSPEVTAIATGDVDIITLGFSTFATAIQNGGLDLRIVADGFQDGIGDNLSSPYIVRNDSNIRTVEDLKGKVLVDNAIGGSLDVALRAMLRQHHLEDRRDYTIVEGQFPNMNALLAEKKVDLIASSPPFIYDPGLTASAHSLFTMKDAVGPTQMIVFAARADFLAKNRPALQDFFSDMLVGIHWFLDPANRKEALQIVADATKLPVARYADYLYTKADYYHDPEGRPNLAALQRDMKTERDLGFLKADLDVAKYTDLSFIDAAAKQVK